MDLFLNDAVATVLRALASLQQEKFKIDSKKVKIHSKKEDKMEGTDNSDRGCLRIVGIGWHFQSSNLIFKIIYIVLCNFVPNRVNSSDFLTCLFKAISNGNYMFYIVSEKKVMSICI